jgi:hypothetical protein
MDDTKLIHMDPAGVLADDDVLYVVQDPGGDVPQDRKITTTALRAGLVTQVTISEVPVGTIDGSNANFALSFVPVLSSLSVFKNGLLQDLADTGDFTLSGQTVVFNSDAIPTLGDKLRAVYRKQ